MISQQKLEELDVELFRLQLRDEQRKISEQRLKKLNKKILLLDMKDVFDDEDREQMRKMTEERNSIILAQNRADMAIEESKEKRIKEMERMQNTAQITVVPATETVCTGVSLIDNMELDSFAATLNKITRFQEIVKSQLKDGHDYGVIPGTSKPTLLKPGAEKILMLMGLTSQFDVIDSTRDFKDGFFQYQVKCRLYKNGVLITEGLGACNTKESKYIKRDACSIDNTILKMAKKRALVDATLLVASLSDLFTQDTEDMDFTSKPVPAEPAQPIPREVPAPVEQSEPFPEFPFPEFESATIPPYLVSSTPNTALLITEKQRKRMFAISNGNTELCRRVCTKYGYKHSADIKRADYESMCSEIEKEVAAKKSA